MCLFSIFYDTKVRCFVCVNVILHRMTVFEWSFVKNRKTAETSRVPEQTLPVLHVTRRRPKALTRDVWVSERITGMLDGNGS